LAEARSLVERNDVALRDPDGQAFLQASSEAEAKAHTYELRKARRRQRLLGGVAGGAILFAIAAFVAAVMAFNAQQTADLARQELLVQRNAAQAAQQQAEQQANICYIPSACRAGPEPPG